MNELYRLTRPTRYADVVGQSEAIEQLKVFDKKKAYPHVMAFTGPSGVGKTTLARIVAARLLCKGMDLQEINAASSRGIDTIREIEQKVRLSPMYGPCRVFIIDECHQLSSDAMDSALVLFEDVPSHVHFLLATTKPDKLKDTIRTRCTHIKLKALSESNLTKVLLYVAVKMPEAKVSEAVAAKIVDAANGSARQALVLLNQVMGLPDEKQKLDAIQKEAVKEEAFSLVRCLLWEKAKWSKVASVLKNITEEAESLRHMILAIAAGEMLKDSKFTARAATLIMAFECDYYWPAGRPGLASLYRACYEVTFNKE